MDLAKESMKHTTHEEKHHPGATNPVGYGLFNVGIIMVAPKAPRRRAHGKKGKKGRKGKRSKPEPIKMPHN